MTKEEVLEAANVMIAYANGKKIGTRPRRSTEPLLHILYVPTWNWEQKEYHVIPDPTYRPWTADEVPLGAFIRPKQGSWRSLILAVDSDWRIMVHCGAFTREAALERHEHSLDGGKTWKECGVYE